MKQLKYILLAFLLLSISLGATTQNKSSQKPRYKTPIMGWASWNNYRVEINEDIIKAQADAMVSSGLKDAGYNFINTDDGFYGGRDEEGNLLVHPERFPSGMKALAEYIHSKGLNAGIYSDAGINTCASYWDKDTIGAGMGLYGNELQDLTLYLKEWDYDFIKVDWCGGEWMGLDEEVQYTHIANLARSIKPSVIFNICRWEFPGIWATQVADSWRISADIDNTFESILAIIDINADLWKYASYGHYNDMDMLQVGRGMSYEEDKAHFTMWAMMHSPLLLGNDLTEMSDETLEIVTNQDIIALNQSSYVYQARRLVDYGDLEVWAKPLTDSMSGEVAVALLNRSDKPQSIKFALEQVGLDASAGYTMQDLWSEETYDYATDSEVMREVPSHGVVVLQIKGTSIPFNVFQYKD
ncbi:MAG: glycoside hydrolase family 27 protein [Bacteroidales bacterium]|nr:glycoside hydrolase family 27 protein [Bacteroidales bacterium]